MATKVKTAITEISITRLRKALLEVCILGESPIILNRMSEKALRELLYPDANKNTAASRAQRLKHEPWKEFRASPYTLEDDKVAATFIAHLGSAFKAAMADAALRTPGAKKTEIAQLTYVEEDRVPIYGLPQIMCSVVRSADMNRTPDVRTRCVIPHWAARFTVSYTTPNLNEKTIMDLIASAGQVMGVGDWRPEKGSGAFGRFEVVSPNDKRFLEVIKCGGRSAQLAAMKNPEFYDRETQELLAWFDKELTNRGATSGKAGHPSVDTDDGAPLPPKSRKSRGNGEAVHV